MHGDYMLYAEEADGVGGLVEFTDQFHVTEDGGVAGMIGREAAGHSNDESGRFAGVDSSAAVVDGIRMEGMSHGHLKRAGGVGTAFAHGADFLLEAFFRDVEAGLEDGDDFGMVLLCEGEEIAEVVGVSVRKKNSVKAGDGFEARRAEGIGGDPRVDEGDFAGSGGERKCAVTEVGDAIAFGVEHVSYPRCVFNGM